MLESLNGPFVVATFDDDVSENQRLEMLAPLAEAHFVSLTAIRVQLWEGIREDADQAGITLGMDELKRGYGNGLTTAIDALFDEFGRFFSDASQRMGRET